MYAEEYLGNTCYLKYNKIVINYNKWFQCQDYRKQLAAQLCVEFTDESIDYCAVYDTFGKLREGETGARNLHVLERWKCYKKMIFTEAFLKVTES